MSIETKKESGMSSQSPVRIKRRTLRNLEKKVPEAVALNDALFGNDSDDTVLTLTRGLIFDAKTGNIGNFILLTIYWGFPENDFGVPRKIIQKWEIVKQLVGEILGNPNMNREQYDAMIKNYFEDKVIPAISRKTRSKGQPESRPRMFGVKLSTVSKLFYFSELKVDGKKCLIYDNRVYEGIKKSAEPEYRNLRKIIRQTRSFSFYIDYVNEMNRLNPEHPDELEYALWMKGKNKEDGK